jgi:hypothetical protein
MWIWFLLQPAASESSLWHPKVTLSNFSPHSKKCTSHTPFFIFLVSSVEIWIKNVRSPKPFNERQVLRLCEAYSLVYIKVNTSHTHLKAWNVLSPNPLPMVLSATRISLLLPLVQTLIGLYSVSTSHWVLLVPHCRKCFSSSNRFNRINPNTTLSAPHPRGLDSISVILSPQKSHLTTN